ncbi:unnamed protein product [Rotaria sp. Silwood1]|nr:unnamed protein product [Rotaria sp. Silwood1]
MPFRKHSITLCERRTKKKTRSWFDWAQLIIAFSVPVAITVYTIFQTKNEAIIAEQNRIQDLSISEKNRLSDIALSQDDQREAILVEYLNSVGKLLDKYGMTLNDTAARLVARYKTLAALEQLDPKRRSLVIRSLYELGLIKSHLPNGEPSKQSATACFTKGKTKEILEQIRVSQTSVKISNIPRNLTIERITNLFSDYNIKNIKVPTDILNEPFGVAFIQFEDEYEYEEFLLDLTDENKFIFVSTNYYTGHLCVEMYGLSETDINEHKSSAYN